ncbi:MAG: DUF4956 domain-containing protein [Saprospiraceae bacterium]|nr:DUF4956 domain-containing protein [Saprospiraceae bacterium]
MEIAQIVLVNWSDFLSMMIRFLINLIPAIWIVRYIYFARYHRTEYMFTYLLFNILIFFICSFLQNAKLSIGFGFGLFAVFGIIRYRTMTVSIREMTYLFIVIALALLNALADVQIGLLTILVTNIIIVAVTYILEHQFLLETSVMKMFAYQRLDLLHQDKYPELLQDLRDKTGLDVRKVSLQEVDVMQETATLKVVYKDPEYND